MNKLKTKDKIEPLQKNKSFTEEQLIEMVKEAEKGPFYTSSEIKERIKNRKIKRA